MNWKSKVLFFFANKQIYSFTQDVIYHDIEFENCNEILALVGFTYLSFIYFLGEIKSLKLKIVNQEY